MGPRDSKPRSNGSPKPESDIPDDLDLLTPEIDPGPASSKQRLKPPATTEKPVAPEVEISPPNRSEQAVPKSVIPERKLPEAELVVPESEEETGIQLPPATELESPDEPPLLPRSSPAVIPRESAPNFEPAQEELPPPQRGDEVVPESDSSGIDSPLTESSEREELPTAELPAPRALPRAKVADAEPIDHDPPPTLHISTPQPSKPSLEKRSEPPPKLPSVLKPRGSSQSPAPETLPPPRRPSPPVRTPPLLPSSEKPTRSSFTPSIITASHHAEQREHDSAQASAESPLAKLYLDPQLTRGLEIDDRSGDDGLHVVLEPRSRDGERVGETGKVVIDLYDSARRTHLGHWEFDAATVRHQYRLSGKRNIPLDLSWQGEIPQSTKLEIIAQMEIEPGRSVRTAGNATIVLPGQTAQRWTPRR